MTENEAINILGEFETDKPVLEMVYGDCHEKALKMAVKALKEIREYRSIGAVSECRESKRFLEFLYDVIGPNEMEKYISMYHAGNEKSDWSDNP